MNQRFLLTLFFGAVLSCSVAKAQVAVIANSSVKASDVSSDELRDGFTGDNPACTTGPR